MGLGSCGEGLIGAYTILEGERKLARGWAEDVMSDHAAKRWRTGSDDDYVSHGPDASGHDRGGYDDDGRRAQHGGGMGGMLGGGGGGGGGGAGDDGGGGVMGGMGELQLPPGAMEQFMLTPEFAHFSQHMIDGFKAQNQPPPDAETIREQYRAWKMQQLLQFRQRQQLMLAQQLMAQQLMVQQQQQQQQQQHAGSKRSSAEAGITAGVGHDGEQYRGGDRGGEKISFRVPADAVGTIMGSKGVRVKEIQHESGARVFVNRDEEPGTNERVVHITGTREAIEHARRLVEIRLSEWRADGGGKTSGPGMQLGTGESELEVLHVPSVAVGFLIGTGGSAIHALQEESRARVSVSAGPDTLVDGQQSRAVTITGRREAVDAAKELISARVALFNTSSVESRAANSLLRADGETDAVGSGWRSPQDLSLIHI